MNNDNKLALAETLAYSSNDDALSVMSNPYQGRVPKSSCNVHLVISKEERKKRTKARKNAKKQRNK